MKTISVVIPFYNENENIERIYSELTQVWSDSLSRYQLEVLLLDNHSSDNSREIAHAIAKKDPRVTYIRLSRNFGFQANILTGLLNCNGDAAIQLDADGEDDPRIIPLLVKGWEEGYQVVYGVRVVRQEGYFISLQRKIFYKLINWLSTIELPVNAGDFRLLDRKVLDCLKGFKEMNPYLRGLIAYAGFNQKGIEYTRRARYKGESKFNWFGYFQLALDGITSFSRKPLAIATWSGFGLFIFSILASFYYLLMHFVVGVKQPGFTTLVIMQLFFAGVQLLCIGILGAYIGRIFEEVKSRPRFIVEEISKTKRDFGSLEHD